jgi:hypothetical protein
MKVVQLEPTNICTYWPANLAFEPKLVLLRRLFFIIEVKTKYVSVSFFPASDYLPLVEFGVVRRDGVPKTIIPSDKHVDAMADGLPKLRDAMCSSRELVCDTECKSGGFRLNVTRSRRIARLYVDTQYISLNLPVINNLSRMFNVVQQQLRDYIAAIQNVLPYVSTALTSVTYVEPAPNSSKTSISLSCKRKSLQSCNHTA